MLVLVNYYDKMNVEFSTYIGKETNMKNKKYITTMKIIGIMAILGMTGCASTTKQEAYDMLQQSTEIELEYAVPDYDTTEDSAVELLPWLQLSSLETHPELRSAFEEYVGVTGKTGSKEGTLYTNPLTTQADQNITLLLAIKNSQFRGYVTMPDALSKLGEIATENYTDVEADDINAPYATINAYFELLPDQTEGQFDGDSTISRAQAMTLVMRATTQVNEAQAPETNNDFTSVVGESQYTDFAAPMNEYTYFNTSNGLTDKTFGTAMSKGEYIYMLSNYFSKDYQAYLDSNGYKNNTYDEDVAISTVSNAGDISFSEALKDSSKGVPSDMYKAFQTAINMQLVTESDLEDWDSAITKGEAVRLFTTMTLSYYQIAGQESLTDEIAENIVYDDVDPEKVDPKSTNIDGETQAALGQAEKNDIEAKYGSMDAFGQYAVSQGADVTSGWCWIYYTGQGAGDQESYAVYMKEDSPRYGEVFHLGDYLPNGQFFVGANNKEHGIADDREFQRAYEKGEISGLTIDEDGTIIIN